MVTSDELTTMMLEIMSGFAWQDKRSKIPDTAEHLDKWVKISAELDEMRSKGWTVEIPGEIPDTTDYVGG